MATEGRYPRFVEGVSALGGDRLRELASHANLNVDARADARAISARLLDAVERPDDLQRHGLTDTDVETIGRALGLGSRAAWRPAISAMEFERLPFYAKPSYELDVWAALASEGTAATKPAAEKPAAKRPAAKKSAAKKPAAKKPAAKKPTAKKPAAKKPPAKKPAAKKRR